MLIIHRLRVIGQKRRPGKRARSRKHAEGEPNHFDGNALDGMAQR
jgi:hypothetical protein